MEINPGKEEVGLDKGDVDPDKVEVSPDSKEVSPDNLEVTSDNIEVSSVNIPGSLTKMTEVKQRVKVTWSDDLSHDSEEERERERLARIERELAALPKKPVYKPEEMQQLISYVMKMTTLYDLRDEDWTDDVKQAIEDWITEPRDLIFCIYFKGDKLEASPDVPLSPVYDLTYFVRQPDYVFKAETFHEDVVFGTFSDSVESNTIQVLEVVYAPYFFDITSWPESVKSEFCSQIHTFLAKLTDMYYKMLGLTVLYIPREGQQLSFEKASEDRELVKRLEGVVVYWTQQIKSCTEDQSSTSSQKELLCPSDKYDFWIYRHENLNALLYQLQNDAVKHITKILITTHSTFIHQFLSQCDEILQKIKEATSNIEFLQIIKHPCAVLECVVDPDDIANHIPTIINLFRVIWMESPYYNSETQIMNLFRSLSNQIIILCRNYINLNDLFEGDTKKALGEFSKCIDCCKKYREIYEVMSEAHNDVDPGSWELDTGSIFNYIDSFVQRCFDMIDVCNCMIIFGRIDELEVINKSMFGGARGEEFEAKCEQMEHMFHNALDNVRAVSHNILDVQAPSWYEDILQFRMVIKDIEIITENLVETVFENVNHVEEAVIALYSLHNYSRRKNLRRIFKKKTSEVWAMFSEEVSECKKEVVSGRDSYPAALPPCAGRAVRLRLTGARLSYLRKVMTDASVWLTPCSNSEDAIMQANKVMSAIEVAIRELWLSWTHTLDEKCGVGLNRTLMRKSIKNTGLLECNIDVNILELCREASHWENLSMEIPLHAYQVYIKSKTLLYVYESVLAVVKGYNSILDALSEEERLLFKPLIQACERKIQPGISKLTWTSTMSDAYIADCVSHIEELQDFLTTYKTSNINLVKIMEKICGTPLIELDVYNVFEIKDLRHKIRQMQELAVGKLLEMFKEIATYIIIVYEGFELHIGEMAEHWVKYVRRYDRMLEDALRLSIKATMQNMYKCVHGDGTMAPAPLIKMKSYLVGNEISFVPTRYEVDDTFLTVLEEIVHIISTIPRLYEKFSLPAGGLKRFKDVIQMDADCNKLQTLINAEIEYNMTMVHSEHARIWDTFSHIWKVNKDQFLADYRKKNSTAADFDALIINYGNLANTVQVQETENQLHFITLNSSELKKSVIVHCLMWQTKIVELLKKITDENIEDVYKYIDKSSVEAMTMPTKLGELANAMATYERLVADVPVREKTFPPIADKVAILGKYEKETIADIVARHDNIPVAWAEYIALLQEAKKALEMNKDRFKAELLGQAEELKQAAKEFCEEFYKNAPTGSEISGKDAMAQLKAYREYLNSLRAQEQQIRDGLAVFNLTIPVNLELQKMEKELEKLEEVWELVYRWEESWEKYKVQTFWEMETDEMEENVMYLFRNFNRLSRQLKDKGWEIIDTTRVKVDAFRRTLPLIGDLKNPCMRERHWNRIKTLMEVEFDQNSDEFKLDLIMRLNFQTYAEDIAEISKAATMELNIENGLKAISEVWENTTYEMQHHKGEMYKINNVDDVLQFLEDHQVQLSSMKSTKYVEPFIKEVDYWEKTLGYVAECIEISLQVQRRYLYLEIIFSGEDIRKQLPDEVKIFDALTQDWTEITSNMFAGKNAVEACLFKPSPYLYNKLNDMIDNLDGILRALEKYLEVKRQIFPRFYFISNDDLLEILGNSKKPQLIQVHLKKLFDNVNKIRIEKNSVGLPVAKAMMSDDGECIEWKYNLVLDGPAETWLLGLEHTMRVVLRDQLILTRGALRKCKYERESWINEWPGQLGITSSKIQWTSDCTRTLRRCEIMQEKKPLKKLRKKQNQILSTLQSMSRKEISKILRCKVNALCVIEIHSRDTVDRMYKMGCMNVTAFEWFSQLKFYWDREHEDCYIKQTNTTSSYTYEYIGNSGRLVITPLTDRCYITLTTALHLYRGGSPQGPAGTGKTETTKDLGRALARWVVVTNCSDGLDYKSMAKCFAGIAQSGCWGCFDEFNRINIEVLSVVAQQILSILQALSLHLKRFVFEGDEIKLDANCGIFITMNPGYAGRTELPDNLKSMFRPIAMCVPDSNIIAENILFSDGFNSYKVNAKKVFTLYQLASQQLSKKEHYDFGLRSMVALLRYAGTQRRAHPNLPEQEIVILAMRDMNVARLTAKDVPLFDGIMQDIFPDVVVPTLDYELLESALTKEMRIAGLQPIRAALLKVIQIFETKNSRHSSMLLGDTNTAKSASWKMLGATLSRLHREKVAGFENVQVFPMNPKALTLGELYGEYNLSTGEWKDGVLSSIMRAACQDESPDLKWIIFDGPVDAIWIENLNSVMDDNKLLTLVNSERISMPPQVSLLIETLDLAVASPATVSRNGIVYHDYRDWGWWPYVNSWLETVQDVDYREMLRRHFTNILTPVLELKRLQLAEGPSVRTQELSGVRAMCRLLDEPASLRPPEQEEDDETYSKMKFLFAMIWSVCGTLDDQSRRRLDNWVREHEGVFPLKDTVYDYWLDERLRQFRPWEDRLPDNWRYNPSLGFHSILVPTVELVRVRVVAERQLRAGHGVLLGGPPGCGKSCLLRATLGQLDPAQYSVQVINVSAQTTAANVQDTIEARLEKRTKGHYVPAGGKKMITCMDDMNMPVLDEFGSQPPLELVRLWSDYGYWFDRHKQWRKNVKDMVICGTVGPPGGARSPLPPRLLSRFHALYLPAPAHPQLLRIFGAMLGQHLQDFDEETKTVGKIVLTATLDMFDNIVAKLLPTPSKMHYLFNLRDLSKVFQGLLRSHKDYQNTKTRFLRLWLHECFRVFCDRLNEDKDRDWFMNQVSDILGKHFELTFHSLCPTKSPPLFGHFLNPYEVYDDLVDPAVLRKYMENQLEEYNSCPGVVKMELVLFRDAIEHVCRIVRVLSQPRGHLLCVGVGGSGRQSLTRLASYVCECNSFQVVVTKTYGVKDFREDLKKLYTSCGVDVKKTTFIFCDQQIADETFTEIVNNLLSSGEITNLYKPDEFEDIKQGLEKPMKTANILQTTESVYQFLVERVRNHLHIVLCFSPIGEAFRNRIRQYPALINSTTTNWFLDWPRDALLEVAYRFLEGVDLLVSITGPRVRRKESVVESREDALRASVASIMSLIHSSVGQYSHKMFLEMRRTNYVTPTSYLELVSGYKEMLKHKRMDVALQANKLRNGLSKIEETTKLIAQMSEELEVAKVQVAEYTQQCVEYMGVINVQQRNADEQQRSVAARTVKTQEEEGQCKRLADAAMRDLASAMPALEEAIKALDALNKKDITEVKSYAKPPQKVEMVLEAVLILLQKEPTWAEAKRQLGDQYFLDRLRDFDKDNISDKTLKKIGTYTAKPDFDPEVVGTVSLAAKSLCLWVRAIEKYGRVYKIVKPKKERLEEALESLRLKQQILAEARARLRELSEQLERLQREYDEKLLQKQQLEERSRLLQLKMERAEALIAGLSGEQGRWELTVERLDKEFDNLPGDCLIATGFVAYLGPFVSEYREELMDNWFREVFDENVPVTMNLSMKYFLLDNATLRQWNYMGLPDDNFSAENGIIVVRATRWPLAVDPQGQALIWISHLEEKNDIQVVDFGQPNYLKIMEMCLSAGKPVIIQNVGETLDPSIAPILDKAVVKIGTDLVIKFNEKMVPYNNNFKMYLTTKLGNPAYTPETLTKTTLVNFSVKEQGLTAQLLATVVRRERPQLEQMRDRLVLTIAQNERVLIDLENDLLRIMYESEVPLLENEELFVTLQTSQRTSQEVKEALATSQVTEKEIDAARQGYVPVAVRASVLFFALNDLSRIDPMYQFSLEAYIDLFTYSIDRSPKSSELEDRINNLNEFHTFAVYKNTCRALFERHKLLLSFHIVSRILFQMGKMSTQEYFFLLKGGIVLDRSEQPDNPTNWLPDECWDNITELNKLPGFHGMIDSFETFSKEWKEWYLNPEPESQPLVGEWNEMCNEFQRILVVRSLRADRVAACVAAYVVNALGPRYVEPPVLDIRAAWEESTWKTSLLFVLSPGVDPTTNLIQLAMDVKMFDKFQSLSLGQGQAETASRILTHAMREGWWVFLANCHLACQWLSQVRGLDSPSIHPRFRLWLSSMPDNKFPLNFLQRSIKMTTEPPQGIKGNLVRLFANLNEEKFDNATPKYRRLLFCVAFFHCALIARKRFRQLGYNAVYSFNDSDFEVSDNLLGSYLEQYEETPWDALRYLLAIINYGGHITDDWDKRVLVAYINQYFCEDALDTQFYRLSSIPAYHIPRDGSLESYRDFLELLPAAERAESVGQHAAADVSTQAQDALTLCSTLFALASTGGGGGGGGEDEKVDELAAEILIKLPSHIDVETTERMMGPEIVMPMCVSLLQEIGYFNSLITRIIRDLMELRRAIEGLVVMSEKLELIYSSIYEGKVPSFWLKGRPSLKSLGGWCRELGQRGAHLSGWAHAPRAPPALCWLPALVAPAALLAAVLQTTARGEGWPIDTLCWEFTVIPLDETSFVRPPRDGGVYIRGLYLEGASWLKREGHLQEPLPMQLVCPMTPIHFKPIRATGRRVRNKYVCPCYYHPMRIGAFVVAVDLHSGKESSDFWVKRGTALLCTLAT